MEHSLVLKRVILPAALVILIAALLIFIFSNSSSVNEEEKNTFSLSVGYLPSLAASPLYAAIANGYFEEEGITVELKEIYSGPEIVNAVMSDSVDFAFGIVPPIIAARSKGVKVQSFFGSTIDGHEIKEHRLLIPLSSEITNGSQLVSKKIAVVAKGTSDYFSLIAYLQRNGIAEEQVEIIPTPHPEIPVAVASGAVDAGAAIEPFITLSEVGNKAKIFDYYYSDQHITEVGTYLASETFISKNKALIEKITRALSKGVDYSNDHIKLRSLITDLNRHGIKFQLNEEVANRLTIMRFGKSITKAATQRTLDEMIRFEYVDKDVTIEKLGAISSQF